MARILIIEPDPEVRDLIALVVRRLGHDEVVYGAPADAESVDAVLIEPGEPAALAVAHATREREPTPIVCVSIHPPSREALALEPAAYLLKPFSLADLERALATALGPVAPAPAAAA